MEKDSFFSILKGSLRYDFEKFIRDIGIIEFCLGNAMMQNKCSFSLTQILKIQLKMKESMFSR